MVRRDALPLTESLLVSGRFGFGMVPGNCGSIGARVLYGQELRGVIPLHQGLSGAPLLVGMVERGALMSTMENAAPSSCLEASVTFS
jgi:hypothetical protein